MNFEKWRELFMKTIGIEESYLKYDDPDLEKEMKVLYEKAKEAGK